MWWKLQGVKGPECGGGMLTKLCPNQRLDRGRCCAGSCRISFSTPLRMSRFRSGMFPLVVPLPPLYTLSVVRPNGRVPACCTPIPPYTLSGIDLHRLADDPRCPPSIRMELLHNIELLRT